MSSVLRCLTSWLAAFVVGLCLSATVQAQPVVTYFHNDLSGSPAMATDANGLTLWKESYRPYGSKQTNAAESAKDAIGFTGRPFDASTGLSYMDARYYDPVLGRFMGVDPAAPEAGNVHSLNRYAYANNNPLRYVDPDGNSPLDVAFLVWDLGKLGVAVYSGVGVGAAAADVAMSVIGVASPIPGTGQALKFARAAKAVDHAVDTVRAIDHAGDGTKAAGGALSLSAGKSKPDFIVSRDGAVVHSSPEKVRASLEGAGFQGKKVQNPGGTESGTIHNVPGMKMDARVMNGGPNHPARVVTSRQGSSQPVNPANGANFGNVPKVEQRERSHIVFP